MNEEKHSLRKCGLCFDRHYMPEKRTMLGLLQIMEDPLGDAAVPLMLLAMAYMAVRIMRKRKGALSK